MGHRKWTKLTDDHDAMVRAALRRYRGHEVKTIGDGFLATFDATTRAVHAAVEIVSQAKTMGLESGLVCTMARSTCGSTMWSGWPSPFRSASVTWQPLARCSSQRR
jgi:hypothetical protein